MKKSIVSINKFRAISPETLELFSERIVVMALAKGTQISGRLVRLNDSDAVLEKADGRRVAVSLDLIVDVWEPRVEAV